MLHVRTLVKATLKPTLTYVKVTCCRYDEDGTNCFDFVMDFCKSDVIQFRYVLDSIQNLINMCQCKEDFVDFFIRKELESVMKYNALEKKCQVIQSFSKETEKYDRLHFKPSKNFVFKNRYTSFKVRRSSFETISDDETSYKFLSSRNKICLHNCVQP